MPRQGRSRQVSLQQARAYLRKAEEYAEAAGAELEAGRLIVAASLAVHAGINAADAVTGIRLGQRPAGQNHDEVLALLYQAGPDGGAVERALLRLLPPKTNVEYDPDECRRRQPAGPSNGLNAAWPWPAGSPLDKTRLEPGELCSVLGERTNPTEGRWAQIWAHNPLRGSAI